MMIEEKAFYREGLDSVETQLRNQWQVLKPKILAERLYHEAGGERTKTAAHHPYLALLNLRAEKRARERPFLELFPGEILLVTEAPGKIEVFEDVAGKYGGNVEVRHLNEPDEEELHQCLLPLCSARGKVSRYSLRVSLGKVSQIAQKYWEEGKAIFATDIVVLGPNDEVLEKPADLEEAKKQLGVLSGKEIRASAGVSCSVPLRVNGIGLDLFAGMYILMKLREISKQEIKNYLAKLGERVFDFAGGVDYSGEGRGFLAPREIIVDGYGGLLNPAMQEIRLGVDQIGVLSKAFKGAPEFLIEALYLTAKAMQEYDIETSWSKRLV